MQVNFAGLQEFNVNGHVTKFSPLLAQHVFQVALQFLLQLKMLLLKKKPDATVIMAVNSIATYRLNFMMIQ